MLRGLYVGGNANNGTSCGLACANANNAPSNVNANLGSRNCLLKYSIYVLTKQGEKFQLVGSVAKVNLPV